MSDLSSREDQLAYAGPGPTFAHVALALNTTELAGADVVIRRCSLRPGDLLPAGDSFRATGNPRRGYHRAAILPTASTARRGPIRGDAYCRSR
jgi:hypothetical protein